MYWLHLLLHGVGTLYLFSHCKTLAPEYEKVAFDFAGDEDVLIAKVNAEAETGVASQYDVKGYPTIKFFKKGSTEAIAFEGDRKEAGLLKFLNKECGTYRVPGGAFEATYGLLEEFTELVKEFLTGKGLKSVIKKAVTLATSLESTYAKYYTILMEKLFKDASFVATEVKRLTKILKNDLSPAKRDDFNVKLNILNLFKSFTSSDEEEL